MTKYLQPYRNSYLFFLLEDARHCIKLYCCIYCGLAASWAIDKKHCKTKLANRCPIDARPDRKHTWGRIRMFGNVVPDKGDNDCG